MGIEDEGFKNASEETQKQILRWMLTNAPNLKRIHLKTLELLSIVPEELLSYVKLPDELDICLSRKQDVHLLGTMSRTRCCLSLVCIYEPLPCIKEDRDDELANCQFRREFDLHIETILQNHQQSLKTVEIVGVYALGRLVIRPC